jgi:AMP phosphorylase
MSDFLKAKKLDITSGDNLICLINDKDAEQYGVGLNRGDRVELKIDNVEKPIIVVIDTTNDFVNEGQIGIYEDIWQKYGIEDDAVVELKLFNKSEAIEAIKKKLAGEELSYEDLYVIISDIASGHLSKIFKTLFIASGYSPGFNDQEIKHMTKALALTGEVLKFTGITADKHSIGGVAGKGITPIVVPIIAANGIIVPNTSTRAITSASATTDMLEVIMPMSFKKEQLEAMIEKSGAFMVWGGGLDLAPADDEIIKIQKAIGIESIDKFVSSILAKKIAQGVNTVIFDVPVGKGAKITEEEFDEVKTKFETLGKEFDIKVIVYKRETPDMDGNAVGPILECKEFLMVYEQDPKRSLQLEEDALKMAGVLLEGVGKAKVGKGYDLAKETLLNGKAYAKFKEIVKNQGGNENIKSSDLKPGDKTYEYRAAQSGTIGLIHNKRIFELARALGNPRIKEAGLYFHVEAGDKVETGDLLVTLYANSDSRLDLGQKVALKHEMFEYK